MHNLIIMQAWYVKLDWYSLIQYSGRNNSVCSKGAFSMYLSAYNYGTFI